MVLMAMLLSNAHAQTSLSVYVPHSGDVDHDGVLTTHDAQIILEIAAGQHSTRPDLPAILLACDVNNDGKCDTSDAVQILQQVVTDWNDYDGDGVPNALDCAPLDARIGAPQKYYPDLDKDGFGGKGEGVVSCDALPPAPLLGWGDDPLDTDPGIISLIVPGNGRIFAVEAADPAQDQQWRSDLLQELGADATALHLQWNYLESAPQVYNGPQTGWLPIANSSYPAEGLALSLSISPITGSFLAVPDDLRGALQSGQLRFSDPAVIIRFDQLLWYLHTQLPNVRLVSMQIGEDIDLYPGAATQQFWDDYGIFYSNVAAFAKAIWGSGLQTGVTVTAASLLQKANSMPLSLIARTDVVDVSYLPHNADYSAVDPESVFAGVQQLVALSFPKPLYFQAVGYPSAPVNGSTQSRQGQFLQAFFDAWDQYASSIPFVCFSRLNDFSRSRADALAVVAAPPATPQELSGYLESLGLRTWAGAGNKKIGYNVLRNMAYERGWLRRVPPVSRSYYMGFTPALYDNNPANFDQVVSNVWNKVTTEGDIVALQFDSGVPWVEALNDDFSSPTAPYSASLLAVWQGNRDKIPAGKKLVVSINASGVPRDTLAPYWGYGEGFRYSNSFDRTPTGVWADSDDRVLPYPWNAYQFDNPAVMTAYLNYCRRVIDFFHPDYLVTAIEVTATLNPDPVAFYKLLQLQRYVYTSLKAMPAYASTKILVSFSATTFMLDDYGVPFKFEDQPEGERELQLQGFYDMLPYMDMSALSLYPHYGRYNAGRTFASTYDSLFSVIQQSGKPFAVTESGFPGQYFDIFGLPFLASPEAQDRYLKLLFTELDRAPAPPDFIINFEVRDGDLAWLEEQYSANNDPTFFLNPQFVEFSKYFRDLGIYDVYGNERPATETWRAEYALPYVPRTN